MRKSMKILMAAGIMSVMTGVTAYAGSWQRDGVGWWYQNDNGSYPVNDWMWIDGNGDGVSECYYFNSNGYCLMNNVTPDGYVVNQNGAWIVNGQIQTQGAAQTGKMGIKAPSKSATAGYSDIMMFFGNSHAAKRDGYYEITNVEMRVYDTLSKNYVESLTVGDKITKNGKTYVLDTIKSFYGKWYYDFVSSGRYPEYYTMVEGNDSYYQQAEGESYLTKVIYTGSVYMSENCNVLTFPAGSLEEAVNSMSVIQFINNGFSSRSDVRQGFIKTDANGVIIEYKEFFMP